MRYGQWQSNWLWFQRMGLTAAIIRDMSGLPEWARDVPVPPLLEHVPDHMPAQRPVIFHGRQMCAYLGRRLGMLRSAMFGTAQKKGARAAAWPARCARLFI